MSIVREHPIDFDAVNAAALSGLPGRLRSWLPGGVMRGHEYVVGDLSGAKGESLSVNTRTGKWADFSGSGPNSSGGDVISLYAAAFHGGSQIDGAKALARELGIEVDGPDVRRIAPVITAPPEPAETWEPMTPPATSFPAPISGYDAVYTYAAPDGQPVGYVVRRNAGDGRKRKIIYGINYGRRTWTDDRGFHDQTAWHKKHPTSPRILYGLDLLAARPTAPVIVVEGEKAADAARLMFSDHVVVTWSGGSGAVAQSDWTPLAGRWVAIWPDNDKPGLAAAAQIEGILHAITADVITLRVDDLPEAADAADVTVDDPGAWLAARSPAAPPPPSEEPPPAEYIEREPASGDEYAQAADQVQEGVLPLGHDRGVYFYYSQAARQVIPLKFTEHTRAHLAGLASEAHFWERDQRWRGPNNSIKWQAIADFLMTECRKIGIYDPSKVRGRGAWWDNGRAVLYLGNELIVGRARSPLMLADSKYVYEAATSIPLKLAKPLSDADARKFLEIASQLRWDKSLTARLFAGFMALAPICGVLKWRPSVWITGGAGSGKSWIYENIVSRTLYPLALAVQSTTTEAGIRHTLGSDARPVLFEEAEAEDAAALNRIQGVLDYMRQSAGEGSASIVKGTGNQSGAKSYKGRSMFLFQSINVSLKHKADESRVTVLSLRTALNRPSPAAAKDFHELQTFAAGVLTPDYCAAFIARSVSLIPVINANAETFARAISQTVGSRRTGDQLGALLAGAYSLHSNKEITLESAIEYVAREEFLQSADVDVDGDRDSEQLRLFNRLMGHKLKVFNNNDHPVERLVLCLMGNFDQDIGMPQKREAELALGAFGVKLDKLSADDETFGIFVRSVHNEISQALKGTPWETDYARTLSRFEHSIKGRELPLTRFPGGGRHRAVFIPLSDTPLAAERLRVD